jgi:hypothetical protein
MLQKIDAEGTLLPLSLIFWGALICIIDLTIKHEDARGQGLQFDIVNDAVGWLMIGTALLSLRKVWADQHHQSVMTFCIVMTGINLGLALVLHIVFDAPWLIEVIFVLILFVTFLAAIMFCHAMGNICRTIELPDVETNWRLTSRLIWFLWILPAAIILIVGAALGARNDATTEPANPLAVCGYMIGMMLLLIAPMVYFGIAIYHMKIALIERRASDRFKSELDH